MTSSPSRPATFRPASSSATQNHLALHSLPKLVGTSNAHPWRKAVLNYMSRTGIMGIIDGTDTEPGGSPQPRTERAGIRPPPVIVSGSDDHALWTAWQQRELAAQAAIKLTTGEWMKYEIEGMKSAKEMWDTLSERCEYGSYLHTKRQAERLKMMRLGDDAGPTQMEEHLQGFRKVWREVSGGGGQEGYSQADIVVDFLHSLPTRWSTLRLSFCQLPTHKQSWPVLQSLWENEIRKCQATEADEVLSKAKAVFLPPGATTRRMDEHFAAFASMVPEWKRKGGTWANGEVKWVSVFCQSLPRNDFKIFFEEWEDLRADERTWETMTELWRCRVDAKRRREGCYVDQQARNMLDLGQAHGAQNKDVNRTKTCFRCHEQGHIAKDCWHR
ncbi:hypothetical protein IAT38_000978 [Cryptococcus sp. DSM 104549]